ncbi:hypothetical protein N7486_009728 [Penicillium sp. IBT 16267x]|nr:hypothetical protein N7486_009728 [Penicillium sp. IBT 16267x]
MPSIGSQSQQSKTLAWHLSRRPTALGIQLLLTIFILAINITVTVYGRLKYGGPIDAVSTTIYTGSCDKADQYGAAVHFLINLLSTAVLGASSFSMQLLVAPTRAEVDKAHRQQKWFDIGITSFRNLRMVNRLHPFIFIVLGASSAILHLLWNSAVFNSFPFISYRTAYVTSDYLTNNITWNVADTFVAEMQTDAIKSYEKLNRTECIVRYMNPQSGAGNVVVVTTWPNNNLTLNDSSSLIESFGMTTTNNWDRIDDWMYHSPVYKDRPYSVESLLPYAHNWSVGVGDDEQWACPVEYCLGQPVFDMDNWCGIHFNQTIMFIVCGMNVVKVLCLLYTWTNSFRKQTGLDGNGEIAEIKAKPLVPEKETLVTIGDAIQSFLNTSDDCTKGMCLASQPDFEKNRWIPYQKVEKRIWEGGRVLRKFSMARKRDWILTLAGYVKNHDQCRSMELT